MGGDVPAARPHGPRKHTHPEAAKDLQSCSPTEAAWDAGSRPRGPQELGTSLPRWQTDTAPGAQAGTGRNRSAHLSIPTGRPQQIQRVLKAQTLKGLAKPSLCTEATALNETVGEGWQGWGPMGQGNQPQEEGSIWAP